jgi:hypothetical protein
LTSFHTYFARSEVVGRLSLCTLVLTGVRQRFLGSLSISWECSLADMSSSQMRVEDMLAGASNWSPWKARMVFVLEDLELWDIVEATVPVIPVTAPILVAEFRKTNNKAKRTICDAVRDHIIPHLMGKTYAYEMWSYLCKLYESSNENQKMVLHYRLRGIRIIKDESVTSFLGRYTQIRDELGAVGEVVDPNSLVRQAMNSFTKPWSTLLLLGRSCLHGRGCGMTSSGRRLGL